MAFCTMSCAERGGSVFLKSLQGVTHAIKGLQNEVMGVQAESQTLASFWDAVAGHLHVADVGANGWRST